MFDPRDHYWIADDGRLWSSAAGALVEEDAEAYADFLERGGLATPWPRDEAGEETEAALDAVLAPYGLRCSPPDARGLARAECARRILAAASANTQANMTAYATTIAAKAANARTAEEAQALAAYVEAVAWVAAMRARWPQLAADGLDPADDANWPELPAEAAALAARF